MDPIYKPPSSLDVTKLPPRKPSPRGGMDTNVPTTPGQSPSNPQCIRFNLNNIFSTKGLINVHMQALVYFKLFNVKKIKG